MDSIDSICEQFSSVEINNFNEYNELVYALNFQSNNIENMIKDIDDIYIIFLFGILMEIIMMIFQRILRTI